MRITIHAIGRMKAGPQAALMELYQKRFDGTGRALGLGPLAIRELEPKKPGKEAECAALQSSAEDSLRIALDETGKDLTSREFATLVAHHRDDGVRDLSFLIGGADGLTRDVLKSSQGILRLGRQTWPHMLVRVMLAEQIYRAATILADHPYHRD